MMTTPKPHVTIYTDGGCQPNPGRGGWAAILQFDTDEEETIIVGSHPETTNNRMELTAAVRALELLTQPHVVHIHTDSQYLRKGITEWIHNWRRNGWLTSAKKPVENRELWQRLYALTHENALAHEIHWEWVKGHSTDQLNQRVDRLATEARERSL